MSRPRPPSKGAAGALWHPSPNFGPRRDRLRPNLIVLHFTAMASAQAALDRLCAPEHEVSSHYLVGRDGQVWQMVDEDMRAWHAGAGDWGGTGDVNSRSIGIELDNSGLTPFSEPLVAALETLLSDIRARWVIPAHGLLAHSDFAPRRKFDPGRRFDWRRLARAGHGIWPEPTDKTPEVGEEAFLANAATFGYPVEEGAEAVLDALRQRFRPWARGPLDNGDMAILRDLATRFPVDRPVTSA
ncbi:N-acetylmuramoyl-L-alanine amidase [Maritimibacter sp. DP1N21-5]|uniref:N-acetylmuramoyl-L-alanine amidase n=1 Tax=Maritimibacter sp. DP1N21-5 TaxID=2836867 RepID=UPI001C4887D1|nr:N-acetylmuramoyl-L-alanine amidase [Maritimibacter sp. DP1N21-5]MBV7410495.1 N-acetylmuramoyl-L-alanine amidase [Maritimibacter sp. DP1N21-5]